jgi:hypothetical protein
MQARKAIEALLLFSAFMVLTTCQLQFNKSAGNSLALQVKVPGTGSGGARGTPAVGANGKDIGGGASLTVTITPPQGATQTLSAPINGKSSIDFSLNLSSSGTYQVTADMHDGSGNLLSTGSTKFSVPMGNYPVVLTLPSNLLNVVLEAAGGYGDETLSPQFSPTTLSYSFTYDFDPLPFTLLVTPVDPSATFTVTEDGITLSPTASGYTLTFNNSAASTVTVRVTGDNGISIQTYTLTLYRNLG